MAKQGTIPLMNNLVRKGFGSIFNQPEGTDLYNVTYSENRSNIGFFLFRDKQFAGSDAVIATEGLSNASPEKCWIRINSLTYRHASTSWSIPGSNPRVEVYLQGLNAFNDFLKSDPLIESASCDPAGREISEINLNNHLFSFISGNVLNARLFCRLQDDPFFEVICTQMISFNIDLLLRTQDVNQVIGATAYPGMSVQLVNRT